MARKASEKCGELYRYLSEHFSEEFATAITKYLNTDFTAGRMLGYIRNTRRYSMEMIVDEMLAILNDREAYFRSRLGMRIQRVIRSQKCSWITGNIC